MHYIPISFWLSMSCSKNYSWRIFWVLWHFSWEFQAKGFRTWELLSIPLAPASYPVLCEFRSIPEDNRERQKSFHESSGRRLSQSLLLAPVPVISSALNLKRKKTLAVRKRQKSVSSLNYTNWFESGKLVSSSEVGIAEKSGLRARKGL